MELIISIIVCVLSVYGAFQMIYNFAVYLAKSEKANPVFSYYVVAFEDVEEEAEEYVRSHALTVEKDDEIIILYNEATNEALQLFDIIASEFNFVRFMSFEEYQDYIKLYNQK